MPQGWTPVAEPAAAPAGWTPVAEPGADFRATNEPPSPSMWERANTPLIPQIAAAADAIADHLDKPRLDRSELEARLEGFVAGATQGAGRVIGGFTSPLGLALTVAGLGPGGAAARNVPVIRRVLALPAVQGLQTAVRVGAGGAVAAHGAGRIATAADAGDVGQGVTELAAGALGMVPLGRAAATLPRPSGPQLIKGALTAGKLIKSPVRTTIGIIADELARRTDDGRPADVAPPGVDRYMPNVSGASAPAPEAAVAPPASGSVPTPEAMATPLAAEVAPTRLKALDGGRVGATKSPQQLSNEAAIARRRAAYQASQAAAPAAAAEPIVAASGKMQLTAAEMKEFTRLVNKGMQLPDALEAVKAMRALATRFGSPTDVEVTQAVARRGYKS